MTFSEENREILNTFISKRSNNSLESYIKNNAWEEDSNGETRVYLVKDSNEKLVLFFSIKCGLLVEEPLSELLSDEKKDLVDQVIDCILDEDNTIEYKKSLFEYGCEQYGYDECNRLFSIARGVVESKNESIEVGQSQNTIKVHKCIPAIELAHLCRNEKFKTPDDLESIPLGFGVFWEVIVPLLINIAETVGCKYVYLFAADKTNMRKENGERKLISYYKNHLKFSECKETFKFIKPEYDNYCYGLVQEVSEMKRNREAVWTEFSDIFGS